MYEIGIHSSDGDKHIALRDGGVEKLVIDVVGFDSEEALERLVALANIGLAAELKRPYDSDRYHPVLAFSGDAYDSLQGTLDDLVGYSVDLTLEDGTRCSGWLAGAFYDEDSERMLTKFVRIPDGEEWTSLQDVLQDEPQRLEQAFVTRIEVR